MPDAARWIDRLEMLVPGIPGDRPQRCHGDGPPVVLLHGLWRGWRAMEPLARILRREGYSAWNIPYPSIRKSIPDIVDHLRREISTIPSDTPLHFITHSLGCIVLRSLLEEDDRRFGRIVMLAPPNQGNEIVDWSKRHPWLHFLLGPAGRDLGSEGITRLLSELPGTTDAAVIMGKRATIPFFQKLLENDNDGIVSVAGGNMPGLKEFAVVDADHTFIQIHPETVRLSLAFLRHGCFPAAGGSGMASG